MNLIFFSLWKDLLKRVPPLINIPHRSNMIQETVEDIIQKQAKVIQR
jgi:metal-responsive CopG/Arc/MetJ family transcriptional regulator